MKNPENIVKFRQEICKTLKDGCYVLGYDEHDKLECPNRAFSLTNCIAVCDEKGKDDIAILEVRKERVIIYSITKDGFFENKMFIEYEFTKNKTVFFMELVAMIYSVRLGIY